jgi:prophage tail gpP-like protein
VRPAGGLKQIAERGAQAHLMRDIVRVQPGQRVIVSVEEFGVDHVDCSMCKAVAPPV